MVKDAKKNGVKYIVKLSVMGADLEPGTTIGRLHRQEEKIIEESGMTCTFLRPNGFMQNFVRADRIIRNQNAFYLPGGDATVSFVDVTDVAAVAAKILLLTKGNGSEQQQHENKSYDITGRAGHITIMATQHITLTEPVVASTSKRTEIETG